MPQRLAFGAEPRGPNGQLVADENGFGPVAAQLDRPDPCILDCGDDPRGLLLVRLTPGWPERVVQPAPVPGPEQLGLGDVASLKVVGGFNDAGVGGDLEAQ